MNASDLTEQHLKVEEKLIWSGANHDNSQATRLVKALGCSGMQRAIWLSPHKDNQQHIM